MSIKAMNYVWEYSPHQGSEFIAHLKLADWAHDDGTSWHGHTELALYSRIKGRQLVNILRALEDSGELYLIPGSGRTNTKYILTLGHNADELVRAIAMSHGITHPKTAKEKFTPTAEELIRKRGVQSSASLKLEGCNPVHGRGVADYMAEMQSSVKRPSKSASITEDSASDPKGIPNINQNTAASSEADSESSDSTPPIIQHIANLRAGKSDLTKRDSYYLLSEVIAHQAYHMKAGGKWTETTTRAVLKDQFGAADKGSIAQRSALIIDVWDMYVWWEADPTHTLSAPVRAQTVLSALHKYRTRTVEKKAEVKPADSGLVEWGELKDGTKRPRQPNEPLTKFVKTWFAPRGKE